MAILKSFLQAKNENIKRMSKNKTLKKDTLKWICDTAKYKYTYNFTWLGRPIIQFPQDILALQEIIWEVKPDLIIETGIAHGGSLIFSSSMLKLLNNNGVVVGIDIDIRKHNRVEIEGHPLYEGITLLEGSSIDEAIFKTVKNIAKKKKNVMVFLDSNHTHNHVLRELELYSTLVTKNSYIVVFDTIIEDMPKGPFLNRPWSRGNNPKTATVSFLRKNNNFIVDKTIENKLLITVAPGGYLKRIK